MRTNILQARKALLALFAMLLSLAASAHDFEVDGIYYNITSEADKTAEVTYKGNDFDGYNNCYSGSITVPATVTRNGVAYSVMSIGNDAFYNCYSLTTIILPESVTSIGNDAFAYCSKLTSITIPESVMSIGGYAFAGCNSLTAVHISSLEAWCNIDFSSSANPLSSAKNLYLNGGLVTELTIPNSVTAIRNDAFAYCSSLTSITIPEDSKLTSIGDEAFYGCSSLTSITIPEGVTSIGDEAFRGCSSLTTITIPEDPKLTSIGERAFYNCRSLTTINIPESVTSIGFEAFAYCSSLAAITLPEGVTSIGEGAFCGCSRLERVTINCANVGSWFRGLSSLKEIVLGESVTSIGDEAFLGYSSLIAITIPEDSKLTSIGNFAFAGCSSLTSITLPEGVTSIENYAFDGCSSLESLHIGPNVDSYGSEAFASCIAIKELTVMGNVMPEIPSENLTSITLYNPIPLETTEFASTVYRNATLNIPEGSLTRYKNADVWKNFWNVNEFDPKEGKAVFLTINQADNGYVKQHLTEGTVCTFTIVAAEGWKIHSVTFNGEEVTTQLTEEGTFTTPALQADAVLNIAYEKTDNTTMVANTTARAIKVQGHRGTLRITGATEGDDISVYTTDGMLVAQESAEGDETQLTLPTGQVYIVTVADKVVKIGM